MVRVSPGRSLGCLATSPHSHKQPPAPAGAAQLSGGPDVTAPHPRHLVEGWEGGGEQGEAKRHAAKLPGGGRAGSNLASPACLSVGPRAGSRVTG